MSFSPAFAILKDWKTTLTVAFRILNRIAFIVTGDFKFGDFNPSTNWSGMTVTNVNERTARYIRIQNMAWVSYDASVTLAAPLANTVTITLPFTVAGESTRLQICGCYTQNGGVGEVGVAIATGATNTLSFLRGNLGAYAAGSARFTVNMFVEVV